MQKFTNVSEFTRQIVDTASKINPIYRRNFSELIKIIPLLGSWIERFTIGEIEDAILNERLISLEEACARALAADDVKQLFEEILFINSILYGLTITNRDAIAAEHQEILYGVRYLVAAARESSPSLKPHPDFRFVTISGPSAVGKDCVMDLIQTQRHLAIQEISSLTKYTTRVPRLVDSKYYNFVSKVEFCDLRKAGNVLFSYFKRDERYGFERTHLLNTATQPGTMFAVFTHFETLAQDRAILEELGISHTAVLLTADRSLLKWRSRNRLLPTDDIEARVRSIDRDMDFIEENRGLVDNYFDLVVNNGFGNSLGNTFNAIVVELGLPEMRIDADKV